MEGYKGFEKGLICDGEQFAENTVFKQDEAELIKKGEKGWRFCALPHEVFEYWSPGENYEFAEVEALDEPEEGAGNALYSKELYVGKKISVFDMAQISVDAFFESFDFYNKIARAESMEGTEVAGDWGATAAGDGGAAKAGDGGATAAGDGGAANVGDHGAAAAGDYGTAKAGNGGTATVGKWGTATVGKGGSASAGGNGIAVTLGGGKAKGELGALLVFTAQDDAGNIIDFKAVQVDGKLVLADTWYTLKDGELTIIKEDN